MFGRKSRKCVGRRYSSYDAGWSSPVAREAHNLEVVGSNPAPATDVVRLPGERTQAQSLRTPGDCGGFSLPGDDSWISIPSAALSRSSLFNHFSCVWPMAAV